MNTVLERNLARLEKTQPDLVILLRQRDQEDSRSTVTLERITTRNNERGFSGAGKLLHSRYDAQREAERIVATSVPTGTATVVALGAGAGFTVRHLTDSRPGVTVVAAERSPAVLRMILEWIDFSRALESGRLRFCCTPQQLVQELQHVHQPLLGDQLVLLPLQQWTELEENRVHFQSCLDAARTFLRETRAQSHTIRRFARPWIAHTLHNSHRMAGQDNFSETLNRIRTRIAHAPVVVAAAGPGLDQFLQQPGTEDQLKKQLLIAVDTALPALRQRGIKPWAVVVLDPQAWSVLHLRNQLDRETILFADAGVAPGVINRTVSSQTIWFAGSHPLHQLLYSAGAPMLLLQSSPDSVTETAVLIARGLGASQVELVGADGGYPRAVLYARGTAYCSLAARGASRLVPAPEFSARRIYPAMTQTAVRSPGKHPFFTIPAMETRTGRILSALTAPHFETLQGPRDHTVDFSSSHFWNAHLKGLERAIEQTESLGENGETDTVTLMQSLGPHGIAHIPLIGRFPAPEHSRQEIPCHAAGILRTVKGFIFEENRRYS